MVCYQLPDVSLQLPFPCRLIAASGVVRYIPFSNLHTDLFTWFRLKAGDVFAYRIQAKRRQRRLVLLGNERLRTGYF